MAMQIHDEDLIRRLQAVAAQEKRPIEDLLRTLLDQYTRQHTAFEAMAGIFDDEIVDLSTSVRETMNTYYQQRDDKSD